MTYDKPFFNEFCMDYEGDVDTLLSRWESNGLLGGLKVGEHTIMFAVTEKRTKEEMEKLLSHV